MVVTVAPATVLDLHHAGPHGAAAKMHGAGAALALAAPELGALQAQGVAQDPEQRHVCRHVDRDGFSVDGEINLHSDLQKGELKNSKPCWAKVQEFEVESSRVRMNLRTHGPSNLRTLSEL